MKQKALITEIIVFLFIVLFLYTAISKLLEYSIFKEQIAASPILAPLAAWIAWLLPAAEVGTAILLFIPRWRIKGLYASFVLMVLFTGYVLAILCFDKSLPCSCGGIIELLSWNQHLTLNIILIGLSLLAILFAKGMFHSKLKTGI